MVLLPVAKAKEVSKTERPKQRNQKQRDQIETSAPCFQVLLPPKKKMREGKREN